MPVKLMQRIQVSSRRRLEYFQSRNWRSEPDQDAGVGPAAIVRVAVKASAGGELTEANVPQVAVPLT